jgi:hypothetical protein
MVNTNNFRFDANVAEEAHAKAPRRKEGSEQFVAKNHDGVFFAPWRLCVSSFFQQVRGEPNFQSNNYAELSGTYLD